MRTYVRTVLVIFATLEWLLGVWLTFLPKTFYDHVPTVDWDPPYNDHLFHDFGAASLGLGVVLTAAAIRLDRYLAAVALLAYLAFALPHLIFHLGHLDGHEPGWSVVLGVGVGLMVLVPLTALAGVRKLT
ncbi:hypothetical protein JOF29_008577 [Kribbella aluminosa]|uniref:DUF4345 domain-containing protein n=1 Tax=Kribbella aluminosa TaxID=416017 RepID=A0ABS4V0U3_9ACTN|nr:hypothetical protein [Kribbella aluminosa]MBP2357467.1 hypothetical protein [Kribbella aluminosa]